MVKFKITKSSSRLKQIIVNASINIDRCIIRHTPKSVLRHFREGTYENNLTKDNPTKGFMSWRKTQRWMYRALGCDCGCYDSQELNTRPLGEVFLEICEGIKSDYEV